MNCDKRVSSHSFFAGNALKQFSQRLAEREDLAEIIGGEVRAGVLGAGTLAADLDDADHPLAGKDWSADHFLDEFGGFAADFDAFEDSRVPDAATLLMISGRLSRAVRAAMAEVLDRGIKPTCLSDSGTRKCR